MGHPGARRNRSPTPREIGEPCVAGHECGEGLYCHSFKQVCAPKTVDFDGDSLCSSLYVQATAEDAKRAGVTMSFGGGTSMSAGASVSYETGLVYGDEGQFGCYASVCAGFVGDVEISDFINIGVSDSWDSVEGWSYVTGQSVETPFAELGFQTSQVWDTTAPTSAKDYRKTGPLVGTASGFSLGVGLAPAAVGQAMCYTALLDSGDPLDQFSDIEGILRREFGVRTWARIWCQDLTLDTLSHRSYRTGDGQAQLHEHLAQQHLARVGAQVGRRRDDLDAPV